MPKLRVIDFETTGLEPPEAVVIEVGQYDYDTETGEITPFKTFMCGADRIPYDNRAIHHISPADIEGWDRFAPDMIDLDGVSAIVAHNADFELKFYQPSVPVICTYKAALRAWPGAASHSNSALRYMLEEKGIIAPVHALTQPPHRAHPDAYVTAHILRALFAKGITGKEMVAWTKEPRLLPTCPLGKMRGKPWSEVEIGFLNWMLAQATMEEDLKWNARREIERRQEAKK